MLNFSVTLAGAHKIYNLPSFFFLFTCNHRFPILIFPPLVITFCCTKKIMVPIPPKHRAFITVPAGLQSESIPAPEGFSLVTTHVYTKLSLFYDNVNKDPTFMNWPYMKRNIEKALNYYYPLTGRLVKGQNGRYSITNFDKGALFEVHDSADLFGDWKKHNFSYSVVPYDEMIPIKSYVSRDSPLFGVKMIYTKDGGAVMNMSFHHKVVDGWCLVQFISLLGRICRGEKIEDDEIFLYTDKDRKPVQPLPNMNYSEFYPSYGPGEMPPPTINLAGPSKKFIFTFEKEAMLKLKKTTLEEAGQPKAKISQFDVLCSFIHRSVVKARRAPADSRADMVCIVGNHQNHPDENMVKYFGNFIM